jgi:hypothetical protein
MALLYSKTYTNRKSIPNNMQNTDRLAPDLIPGSEAPGGNIDIINSFPWTLTPSNNLGRKETPTIILTEFYQKQSALQQQLKPYGISESFTDDLASLLKLANTKFNTDVNLLYEGIFDITNDNFTGFTYILPYFSQDNFTVSNSWEKKDLLNTIIDYQKKFMGATGKLGGAGIEKLLYKFMQREGKGNVIGDLTGQIPEMIRDINMLLMQSSNPAVGLLDPPHVFRATAPREYTVSFTLYNTYAINDENYKNTILKNWELCFMLSYQNSVNKKNFFTGLPPVFYSVVIPGVHFSKASVITNLNISNVGNVRKLVLPIDGGPDHDVNVPDAYQINFTLRDVFMPSKNLYSAVNNQDTQRVISQPGP